jgi:lipoyl(octanoyl) transferase
MVPCRLIVDPPQEGSWNMAVDEALLDDAAEFGVATLRFYQWSEPTLSLGYFQSLADRAAHAASRDAAVVRRLSGGGALMHDRELTYSLCLPVSHPLTRQPPALYDLMHRALIAVLGARDVRTALWEEAVGDGVTPRAVDESFLCFARRTAADVVLLDSPGVTPVKIAGSAQRRRQGAILQHGALLLAASDAAPELPGLLEAAGVRYDAADLAGDWAAAAATNLELELQPAPRNLEPPLLDASRRKLESRYASQTWTARR